VGTNSKLVVSRSRIHDAGQEKALEMQVEREEGKCIRRRKEMKESKVRESYYSGYRLSLHCPAIEYEWQSYCWQVHKSEEPWRTW